MTGLRSRYVNFGGWVNSILENGFHSRSVVLSTYLYPSVASDDNALAPDSENPETSDGFLGAVLGVMTAATSLAKKTPLALFLAGAGLSIAFGVVAYEITTPGDYKEYVWDGGYDGISEGAHQVTFDASSYYHSPAVNPPIQISTHASQAYAGWNMQFQKDGSVEIILVRHYLL